MAKLIIYEAGNGFDFEDGDRVFCARDDTIYRITCHSTHIHTQEPGRAHYLYAEGDLVGYASELTDYDFEALPNVTVVVVA